MTTPRKKTGSSALAEMSQEKLEALIQDCARKAVADVLMLIGVDATNPIKAQATFASLREIADLYSDPEFRSDLTELRAWRKSMSSVKSKGVLTIVGLIVTGVGLLIWQAIVNR